MKLSVAICTWNRSDSLRHTLESLAHAQVPPGLSWEVLVVNNNSTDDTDRVIESFADRLPIRRLFEAAQGLSHARNAAAAAARGDYVLWTDDDVVVSAAWLAAYCRAFERWPNAAVFGGPIRPVFEKPVPRWLQQGWQAVPSAFAAIDLGKEPVALSASQSRVPYGANFAIRRLEQLKHLYNPVLGAGSASRYSAEETTVIIDMLKAGAEGWWIPDAAVEHIIPVTRMSVGYVRRYFENMGRTQFYLGRRETRDKEIRLFGRPQWVWRALIEGESKYWVSRTFQSPDHWLAALRARALARGAFAERDRKRPP